MARKHTYSTVEVCELFGISRSTLFRWEKEGWFPHVERDEMGQRLYTDTHLRAIAQRLKERYKRQYEQALSAEDKRRMENLARALSFVKFLEGKMEGLQELAEYDELPDHIITQLLRFALERHTPSDAEFCQIMYVVYDQCRKRTEGRTT